jgi:hypothetical protein
MYGFLGHKTILVKILEMDTKRVQINKKIPKPLFKSVWSWKYC